MSTSRRRPSPSLRSPRTARGGWISLFAMLMIFIGPLISQAMPMDHSMPMAMPMSSSMDASMHSGMAMEEPGCHDVEHGPQKPDAEHRAMWEKCGYCSLLFSCPALPQTLTFEFLDRPRTAAVISAQPHLGHARAAVFPGARTRAPPAIG